MPSDFEESTTVRLQRCLDRVQQGDARAQEELIDLAWKRLLYLTTKMFRGFPQLRRFEDSDDINQKAMVRFWDSLKRITPRNLREFFALAALHIRRTLIDLARHYFGPTGAGTNEGPRADDLPAHQLEAIAYRDTPAGLLAWEQFHNVIGALPTELREVFELIWYYELSRDEVAQLLGISSKAVKERWREARLEVFDRLDGQLPSC